jgi:hypothetical protein
VSEPVYNWANAVPIKQSAKAQPLTPRAVGFEEVVIGDLLRQRSNRDPVEGTGKIEFLRGYCRDPKADGTPLDSFDIPHDGLVFLNYPPY